MGDGQKWNQLLGIIYGSNAVQQIVPEKTVQPALRGHLFRDQCFTQKIDKVICDARDFAKLVNEMQQLYMQTLREQSTKACLLREIK